MLQRENPETKIKSLNQKWESEGEVNPKLKGSIKIEKEKAKLASHSKRKKQDYLRISKILSLEYQRVGFVPKFFSLVCASCDTLGKLLYLINAVFWEREKGGEGKEGGER